MNKHLTFLIAIIFIASVSKSQQIHYNKIGVEMFNNKKFDSALVVFNKAIELNGKNHELLSARSRTKFFLKDYNGAILDISKSIAIDSTISTSYFFRAIYKTSLNDFSGALTDYTRSISINPQNWEAYGNRGVLLYVDLKETKKALEDLNIAIANTDNPSDRSFRADVYKDLGNITGAVEDLKVVCEKRPTDTSSFLRLIGNYYELKNFNEVLAYSNKLIALNENEDRAYYYRAEAKEHIGKLADGLSDYEKALSLKPKNANYHHTLGLIKGREKDYKSSLAYFNQAIALNPKLYQAYRDMGIIYFITKDFTKVIVNLKKYLEDQPNDEKVLNLLGSSQLEVKDYKAAIVTSSKIIAIYPKNANAYHTRAEAKDFLRFPSAQICADFKLAAENGDERQKNLYTKMCK